MTTPHAVIWDVDGTLVDTAEQHFRAWVAFAAATGRPFSRADFAATFGMRNPEVLRQLFDPGFTDAECAALAEQKESMYREFVRHEGIALLPGVADLLEGFRAAGWLQAVGSSAPAGNLTQLLDITGTARFFTAVVSGHDVSRGKPDPEVFLTAAARLGADPRRCLVLEDAVAGVQAAKAAGMKCVAVTFVGHHPAENLRAAGADRVVGSLAEVTADEMRTLVS